MCFTKVCAKHTSADVVTSREGKDAQASTTEVTTNLLVREIEYDFVNFKDFSTISGHLHENSMSCVCDKEGKEHSDHTVVKTKSILLKHH